MHLCTEYNILQKALRSSQTSEACCGLFRTCYSKCDPAASASPRSLSIIQEPLRNANFQAPNLALMHQDLHFDETPQMMCVSVCVCVCVFVCVCQSLIHHPLGVCLQPPDEELLLSV